MDAKDSSNKGFSSSQQSEFDPNEPTENADLEAQLPTERGLMKSERSGQYEPKEINDITLSKIKSKKVG